jgi:predicted ATPase/transcriptional regulator with XRE-family HTH domain
VETEQLSSLGALLVRTRKRAELTQEGLAARAGVSANTVSNLEAGRGHLPRQTTLDLLVHALAAALALDTTERAELQHAFQAVLSADRSRRQSPADGAALPAVAARSPLPRGVLTFLICRTLHVAREAPEDPRAVQQIRTWLAALLQQVAPRHGGRLMDPPEGPDGAVCAFPQAAAAVLVAGALQQALWDRPAALGSAMEDVAMGAVSVCLALHTGWAEPGADDRYAGPTRRRATRLVRLGHGGQILLTPATCELVKDRLPEGVWLQRLGQHRLSAVERPQLLAQLLPAMLPRSFPPLRPLLLPPTNLPVQLTSFIGRVQEQTEVETLLGQAALVTLVGAGGCGKTRLALAIAADLLEEYPDGVWLVELAALRDPALVPQAVTTTLGLREEAGLSLLTTLVETLRSRRLLLVLDNCEHLLSACADLATALLRRCPYLHLLATSREPLAISGESSYRVHSLALPAPDQQAPLAVLGAFEGVRLFVERARASRPDFVLREENAVVVARICRRLDGMPLAIELAAARVGSLPVEAIATRLAQSLSVLTGGPRDALPRQQTLRATLDWSWALLEGREQLLLRRLAAFAGGWRGEAAEAVCAGDGLEGPAVPDLLAGLTNKSLVGLDESDDGVRYGLLETVRQYAAEQLAEAGEAPAVRDRHLAWCVALAEEAAPHLSRSAQGVWLRRLELEHDNLRAALIWARDQAEGERGLRLAVALSRFWYMRGYLREGRGWLEEILAGKGVLPADLRATALKEAGNLALRQGEYGQAGELYEQALALFRDLNDKEGMANSLTNLGIVADRQGEYKRAAALFEQAVVLARERGDTQQIAKTLNNLAAAWRRQGDYARQAVLYEEALALFQELRDRHGISAALDNLGQVAFWQGEYKRAAALHEESLAIARELGDRHGIIISLINLGAVAERQGDYGQSTALLQEGLVLCREIGARDEVADILERLSWVAVARGHAFRAVLLGGAAQALWEALSVPLAQEERADHDRAMLAMRAVLGEVGFAAAWAEGRALPLDAAVALALEDDARG